MDYMINYLILGIFIGSINIKLFLKICLKIKYNLFLKII
jgi:hypothetical protein